MKIVFEVINSQFLVVLKNHKVEVEAAKFGKSISYF